MRANRAIGFAAIGIAAAAASASAEPLEMVSLDGPAERPAANQRACTDGGSRTMSKTVAKHRVDVVHECDVVPASSELAIETPAGWFVAYGATIRDAGANMTDAPLNIAFVRESLAQGTLADGSAAIVLSTITRWENVCHVRRCADRVVHREHHVVVTVCAATDDGVSCGHVDEVCPARGCGSVSLRRGRLAVAGHTYTIGD